MSEHDHPASDRPEELIRTPDADSEQADHDEDLALRVDTEEWQESATAEPAAPDSVRERMTGPRDHGSGTPDEDDRRDSSADAPADEATGDSRS
ncbi:MAG: hypothetical protein QM628_17465 [Propionicimonas sp.]